MANEKTTMSAVTETVGAVCAAALPDPQTVALRLNREGIVTIEGAISEAWLQRARAEVAHRIETNGKGFLSTIDVASEEGSVTAEIVDHSPELHEFLRSVVRHGAENAKLQERIYNVLRIINSRDGQLASLGFHFDSHALTALVPVIIPEEGLLDSGHLAAWCNRRTFQTSLWLNLAHKLWFQRRSVSERLWRNIQQSPERYVHVLRPGTITLFWGYRTLHANTPCRPDTTRCTLLLHVGEPNPKDHPAMKLTYRVRDTWLNWRDRRHHAKAIAKAERQRLG